jgi:CheY-like chemotaxis protein
MKNILLVEDDYLDTMSVSRSFSKANIQHKLTVARNGKEALDLLHNAEKDEAELPDIILLDINMPKMNGIEFLRRLRTDSNPRLKNITVFIMTTSEEEAERKEAQQLGIKGYIIKPLSFDNFESGQSSMDSFNLLVALLKG